MEEFNEKEHIPTEVIKNIKDFYIEEYIQQVFFVSTILSPTRLCITKGIPFKVKLLNHDLIIYTRKLNEGYSGILPERKKEILNFIRKLENPSLFPFLSNLFYPGFLELFEHLMGRNENYKIDYSIFEVFFDTPLDIGEVFTDFTNNYNVKINIDTKPYGCRFLDLITYRNDIITFGNLMIDYYRKLITLTELGLTSDVIIYLDYDLCVDFVNSRLREYDNKIYEIKLKPKFLNFDAFLEENYRFVGAQKFIKEIRSNQFIPQNEKQDSINLVLKLITDVPIQYYYILQFIFYTDMYHKKMYHPLILKMFYNVLCGREYYFTKTDIIQLRKMSLQFNFVSPLNFSSSNHKQYRFEHKTIFFDQIMVLHDRISNGKGYIIDPRIKKPKVITRKDPELINKNHPNYVKKYIKSSIKSFFAKENVPELIFNILVANEYDVSLDLIDSFNEKEYIDFCSYIFYGDIHSSNLTTDFDFFKKPLVKKILTGILENSEFVFTPELTNYVIRQSNLTYLQFNYKERFTNFFSKKYNIVLDGSDFSFYSNVERIEKIMTVKPGLFEQLLKDFYENDYKITKEFLIKWKIIMFNTDITREKLWTSYRNISSKYDDYEIARRIGAVPYTGILSFEELAYKFKNENRTYFFFPLIDKAKYHIRKNKDKITSYYNEDLTDLIEDHYCLAIGNAKTNIMFTLEGIHYFTKTYFAKNPFDENIIVYDNQDGVNKFMSVHELSLFKYYFLENSYLFLGMLPGLPFQLSSQKIISFRRDFFTLIDYLANVKASQNIIEKIKESKENYVQLNDEAKKIIRDFFYDMFFLGLIIRGWSKGNPIMYEVKLTDLKSTPEKVSRIINKWMEFFGSQDLIVPTATEIRNTVRDFLDKFSTFRCTVTGSRLIIIDEPNIFNLIFDSACLRISSEFFIATGYAGIIYLLNEEIKLTKDNLFTIDIHGRKIENMNPITDYNDAKMGVYLNDAETIAFYYSNFYKAFGQG